MSMIDLLQLFSIFGFVVIWCWRSNPKRTQILLGLAVVAILLGLYHYSIYRWQGIVGTGVAVIFLLGLGIERIRARKKTLGKPIFSGILFTLLAFVSYFSLSWFSIEPLPEPEGEHPVGVRDFILTDTSRLGVPDVAPDAPRKLMVRVWYPAETVEGLEPRPFFSEAEYSNAGEAVGKLLNLDFLGTAQGLIKTNSFENAAIVESDEPLPVVVYSHGYTSYLGQNTALMEHMASHGYIIYSVHHTGDASDIVGPDGEILKARDDLYLTGTQNVDMDEMLALFMSALAGETWGERWDALQKNQELETSNPKSHKMVSAAKWTKDRIFVLDQLEAGNVPSNVAEIVAAGRFDRTGQMGMSFGGSTAGDICQKDKRCVAGINLDGGEFHGTSMNEDIRVPFLFMSSDPVRMVRVSGGTEEQMARAADFNDFAYERHETAGLRKDVYRIRFHNSDHTTYSDLRWHFRGPLLGAVMGDVDPLAALTVQNDFVRGFFDKHLKNENTDYPAAQLKKYEGQVDRVDISPRRTWWLSKHPEDRVEVVSFESDKGVVEFALYPEKAPEAVAAFMTAMKASEQDIQLQSLDIQGTESAIVGSAIQAPMDASTTTGLADAKIVRGTVALLTGDDMQVTLVVFLDDVEVASSNNSRYAIIGKVFSGLPLLDQSTADGHTLAISAE